MELIKKTNIDFMSFRKPAYIISAIIILISLISFFTRGLNYGVDFAGGLLLQYSFDQEISVEEVRSSLADLALAQSIIQKFSENEVVIRTLRIPDETREAIKENLTEDIGQAHLVRIEEVGPAIGADLRRLGVIALIAVILGILLYVSLRFEFRPAVTSVLALAHDGLVVIGILALFQREFTIPVLAAVLTTLGYSINDSIVIMDRVRENFAMRRREPLCATLNRSINETLSRTINTSLTTLLPVLALLIFGGRMLQDFSLTMLIGLLVGTYSTVFIAGALLVDWEGKKPVRR
ncbi:MAG TPA: protein translocase subunit SecF [Atribacteraceae bacterium]|nr:protein translocase subunit SecF [Atribacteraceae bacterium]